MLPDEVDLQQQLVQLGTSDHEFSLVAIPLRRIGNVLIAAHFCVALSGWSVAGGTTGLKLGRPTLKPMESSPRDSVSRDSGRL